MNNVQNCDSYINIHAIVTNVQTSSFVSWGDTINCKDNFEQLVYGLNSLGNMCEKS
jgi:hypothetical protein